MLFGFKMRSVVLLRVPVRFEPAELADNPVSGIDGVSACAHLTDMHRQAAHLNLKPDHVNICPDQFLVLGLGD